ncbi:MAG: G5 domain-containing protein [Armatimonadetes bacterium]|nr:G5 domain-containing protein [Armatimonadota bacterium]
MSEYGSGQARIAETGRDVVAVGALQAEVRFLRAVVLLCVVVLLVLLAAMRVGGCGRPVRALMVDGKLACYVPNEATAERVRKGLIQEALGDLKNPAAIKERWEVVRPQVVSAEQAIELLRDKVHVQIEAFGIEVDGKVMLAVPTEADARQVLEMAKARFAPNGAALLAPPRFRQTVRLVHAVVASDELCREPAKAVDRLLGAGTQQYHTVRAGDTPAKIAARYGMKLADLWALNPGLRGRNLRAGQKILVRTSKPALTVVTVREETDRKPIPPPEQVEHTSALPDGERRVLDEGEPGEKLVTLKATYENDRRVKAQVLAERVIKQPRPRKVLVGTRPTPPEAPEEARR